MIIKNGIDKAVKRNSTRFFMPGHKAKGGGVLHYDVTEIDGTDNLTCPTGMLMEAQDRAAEAFGADDTLFCVNGSTIGLHALIMSVCRRGDTLCVDRNCHTSVINALILHGVTPYFIHREYNSLYNIFGGVSAKQVEDVLRHHPEVKGVLVTSPTYYGICSNLWEIAQTAHNKNIPLIVDEAHGAHLHFSQDLPMSAMEAGADACVQSSHKTLNCLTQASMLHIKSKYIDAKVVKENLNMLQTTSPSYLLLASLDNARLIMEKSGDKLIDKILRECEMLRVKLNSTNAMRCLDYSIVGSNNIYAVDETRLVINLAGDTEKIRLRLQEKYNIFVEFTDNNNIICIATVANTSNDFFNLCVALQEMASSLPNIYNVETAVSQNYVPRTSLKITPTQAFYADNTTLPPLRAVGRIAARTVCNYPPGIPVLIPGEVVTQQIAESMDCHKVRKVYVVK